MKVIKDFFKALKEYINSMLDTFGYALDMFILRSRYWDELRRLTKINSDHGYILLYYNTHDKNGYGKRVRTEAALAFEQELIKLGYITILGADSDYLEFEPPFARIKS